MQQPTTRWANGSVRSVPQEVVGEVVPVVLLNQDPVSPEFVYCSNQGVRIEVARLAQQIETEITSNRSSQAGDLLCGRRDLFEAVTEKISQVAG